MRRWEADLVISLDGVASERTAFAAIEAAAQALGFDHCAFLLRVEYPLTDPRTIILNRYSASWWASHLGGVQFRVDSIEHAMVSSVQARHLRRASDFMALVCCLQEEALHRRMDVGWTQSGLAYLGLAGMLTVSRHSERTSTSEANQAASIRWLVAIAHQFLFNLFVSQWRAQIRLTSRETEVLRWSAVGKTSGEVSIILAISEHTVNFHIKNAVAKLHAANKTAAVVRAALLGMLT